MTITLELGHIIIGSVMFFILGIMIYAQGRIDEMRTNADRIKSITILCQLYFDVAAEIIGDAEAINKVNAKIRRMIENASNKQN